MGINRIILQPANKEEAEEQYNLLLTQYHAVPYDKKADPLNEIIFYPCDKAVYTYRITESMDSIMADSISILLKSVQEISEFLLLSSLGLSDNEIKEHFNNK